MDGSVKEASGIRIETRMSAGSSTCFKHPSGATTSYGACVSVCKAAESALEAEEAAFAPLRNAFEDSIFFTLIKPVVIVDGLLVSAMVASDASIELTEISSAVLRFQFRTAHYTRQNYTIDLVSLSDLATYLDLSEQRVRHFLDALAEPAAIAGGDLS